MKASHSWRLDGHISGRPLAAMRLASLGKYQMDFGHTQIMDGKENTSLILSKRILPWLRFAARRRRFFGSSVDNWHGRGFCVLRESASSAGWRIWTMRGFNAATTLPFPSSHPEHSPPHPHSAVCRLEFVFSGPQIERLRFAYGVLRLARNYLKQSALWV